MVTRPEMLSAIEIVTQSVRSVFRVGEVERLTVGWMRLDDGNLELGVDIRALGANRHHTLWSAGVESADDETMRQRLIDDLADLVAESPGTWGQQR